MRLSMRLNLLSLVVGANLNCLALTSLSEIGVSGKSFYAPLIPGPSTSGMTTSSCATVIPHAGDASHPGAVRMRTPHRGQRGWEPSFRI